MSMLAERKRKQRWSLNPRGKAWFEDNNGFGQKMLEKMGWKHGKGLGANEQGLTESLKVSYKNDNKGMGYKDVEGWTEHDQNFSSFLENLNGGSEQVDEIKVASLEKKVQNCRARINYHKFTKAKDLSRYSEKDLANIFGKKSLKENKSKTEVEVSQEIVESHQNIDGDMLVNKGSMADYFKKKLPSFGKAVNNVRETESESENERVGFGFQQASENTSGVPEEKKNNKRKYFESFFPHFEKNSEETVDEHKEKKKRRKNSMIGNFVSYVYEDNEETRINCEENIAEKSNDFAKSKKKSKKSKIDKEESKNKNEDAMEDNEEIVDNSSSQAQNEIDCEETHHCQNNKKKSKNKLKKLNNEANIEESSKPYQEEIAAHIKQDKKQKKLKKKSKEEEIDAKVEVLTCSKKDKKSKSKKKSEEIQEDICCIDSISLNNVNNVIEDESNKNCKKSKSKKKNEEIQDDTSCIDSVSLNNVNNVIEDDSNKNCKQSKSKKKNEDIERNLDCISSETLNNGIIHEIQIEDESKNDEKQKKSKKLKKHGKNGIENDAFSDYPNENELICEETAEETDLKHSIKKQKKTKKKKLEEIDSLGISNLAFDDLCNSSSVSTISLQDEFKETPPKKKKKKKNKNEDGIDNPTFNIAANEANTLQNQFELKTRTIEEKGGLDNPALSLNEPVMDCELMLNTVNTPVILKKPVEKFALNASISKLNNVNKGRRKSVRFNDVPQEHIIPNDPTERINEYISNRNELFDINTMVIEESLKEEMQKQGIAYDNGNNSTGELYDLSDPKDLNKRVVESSVKEELNRGLNSESCGFVNNGFDIRSVDKIDFLNDRFEVKSSPSNKDGGIDNRGFNKLKNQIEENVQSVSNTIERFQAEVENDINESKAYHRGYVRDWLVGDVGYQIDKNERTEQGIKLCYKEMHFKTPVPHYLKTVTNRAKKSYRHLIRGDITLAFKNSNLHEIKGYAVKASNEFRWS